MMFYDATDFDQDISKWSSASIDLGLEDNQGYDGFETGAISDMFYGADAFNDKYDYQNAGDCSVPDFITYGE